MKALVLHGPGRFGVEPEWPDPQPRPGWARIRVARAGICGSDLPRFVATGSYHHPMILGHEFAGIVDEPAPDSERYRGGEPVAVLPLIPCGDCPGCDRNEPFHCERYQFLGSRNDGGFAQYCLVPEENLFPPPPGFDLRWGAFLEPLAVGLHVVRRSGFTLCPCGVAGKVSTLLFPGTVSGSIRPLPAPMRTVHSNCRRADGIRIGRRTYDDPSAASDRPIGPSTQPSMIEYALDHQILSTVWLS